MSKFWKEAAMARDLFRRLLGILAAGCWLSAGAYAEPAPLTVKPDAGTTVPELFARGEVDIAVVRFLNTGDVFQEWMFGVQDEAKRLGVNLTVYNADGDSAKMALHLNHAVATNPDAILINSGFGESLASGLDAAKNAGIPVVTSNSSVEASDHVTNVNQSERMMMRGILDRFKDDMGGGEVFGNVIYVYVSGYRALDIRNGVWEQFLKDNPGIRQVAQIGVVNANTAAQTADQAKAALLANRDTIAVIAPFDEFAKGATTAILELELVDQVKVYGMDISTADIAVMIAENSPWVATATTDMRNLGRVSIRVAAGEVADSYDGNHLLISPRVITQDQLRAAGIRNIDQLDELFPELATPDLAKAPWMYSAD